MKLTYEGRAVKELIVSFRSGGVYVFSDDGTMDFDRNKKAMRPISRQFMDEIVEVNVYNKNQVLNIEYTDKNGLQQGVGQIHSTLAGVVWK